MRVVWSTILIICIVFSFAISSPNIVLESITNSSKSSIENIFTIASMLLFWSGIFNILSNTKVLSKVASKIYNIFSFLFKKEEVSQKAKEYISLNIASNLLGIGNASTINSLNGIEELQKPEQKSAEGDKPNVRTAPAPTAHDDFFKSKIKALDVLPIQRQNHKVKR